MTTKTELEAAILAASQAHNEARAALAQWEARAENNVFASLSDAESALKDALRIEAHNDCEGAGNCGASQYHRAFMVDGREYMATLDVEYNRHDKTYYYIESVRLSIQEKQPTQPS